MSSRFPPNSESRYPPRDRSPPRFERRGSGHHGGSGASRGNEASYRSNDTNAYATASRDAPRQPPRGPKATQEGGRGGGFVPRGRPYAGRGEARDARDSHNSRRDIDRGDWSRRNHPDSRDRKTPPLGRSRSRTPPRDFRENTREIDTSRITRGPNGPSSANSANSDGMTVNGGFYGWGSHRGRGRGDWDNRGRRRGTFSEEREGFQPRSRSEEQTWDDFYDLRNERQRDERYGARERERDERNAPRRDDDKRSDRGGDNDRYRGDPPHRPDSRSSVGSHTNLSAPLSAIPPSTHGSVERFKENIRPPMSLSSTNRRSSFAQPYPETKAKDENRPHQTPSRPEFPRSTSVPQGPSSPPQPAPVPAYGSIAARVGPVGSATNAQQSPREEHVPSGPARAETLDPIRVAPKAPKAELAQAQPPTGPKAQRWGMAHSTSPGRTYESHHDSQSAQSPSLSRYGGPGRPVGSQTMLAMNANRGFNQWTSPQLASRTYPPDSGAISQGFPSEQPNRLGPTESGFTSAPTGPYAGAPSRVPTGPKANQPSIKAPMAPRGLGGKPSTMTWVNPNLQQRQLSMLGTVSSCLMQLK